MKTFDCDGEYNGYSNSTEETTDLLFESKTRSQLRCNSDFIESYNVLKSLNSDNHAGRFYQILSKNRSKCQSLPNCLNDHVQLNGDLETSAVCNDMKCKLLAQNVESPPSSPQSPIQEYSPSSIQDFWFNTWPERYEKIRVCDTNVNVSLSPETNKVKSGNSLKCE